MLIKTRRRSGVENNGKSERESKKGKGRFTRRDVRSTVNYGLEMVTPTKKQEAKLKIRFSLGSTRINII